MDETELAELLNGLERLLEDVGLGAIVEQERRAASEGRVVETTPEDVRRRRRGGSRAEVGDVRLTALTASDRVAMLIDLLEVAVGGTFAITERVVEFADSDFVSVQGVSGPMTFAPDRAEGLTLEDDREWVLPATRELEERRPAVQQVLRDLVELRSIANVQRAAELEPSAEAVPVVADRVEAWA